MKLLLSRLARRFGLEARRETAVGVSPNHLIADLKALVPKARAEGADSMRVLEQALYQAGLSQLQDGYPGQAALALSDAVDLGVNEPYLNYNLALAYSRSGQAAAAHASFERALSGSATDLMGDGYYLRNLYALENLSLEDFQREAGRWADRYAAALKPHPHKTKRPVKSRLRIGLLSARFCRHAVGFLTLAGLENVDPAKIEFILYANGSPEDDYTKRFKALASAWHDITDLTDAAAAELIYSHKLDILIDMAGHSAGGRMGVIARKPAPVQAKWAGGGSMAQPVFQYSIILSPTLLKHRQIMTLILLKRLSGYPMLMPAIRRRQMRLQWAVCPWLLTAM
jgi:protein O-GlcNAc transferase